MEGFMNKDLLENTAKRLIQPDKKSAEEFGKKKDVLAEQVVNNLMNRDDLDNLIGTGNREMLKDNAHNMARFMESVFISYDPEILIETVLWVFRAYRSHGFKLTFWSAHLNSWIEIVKSNLSDDTIHEILPFFNWMQVNIPVFAHLTEGKILDE